MWIKQKCTCVKLTKSDRRIAAHQYFNAVFNLDTHWAAFLEMDDSVYANSIMKYRQGNSWKKNNLIHHTRQQQ